MLWSLGEFRRARDIADRAAAIAAGTTHVPTMAQALGFQAQFERLRGDPARTLQPARAVVTLAQEHGLPFWISVGLVHRGWARWHLGEREAGEADLRRGDDMRGQQGNLAHATTFRLLIAEIEARSGRLDEAFRTLSAMISDNATAKFDNQMESELYRARGRMRLQYRSPDLQAAEDDLRHALAISDERSTRTYSLLAALDLARLYERTDRAARGRAVLSSALAGFTPTPEFPAIAKAQALFTTLASRT